MCAQGTIVRIFADNVFNVLPHAGPELPENSRSGSVRLDHAVQDVFESYAPGRMIVGVSGRWRRGGERLQDDWLAEPGGLVSKHPLVEQLDIRVEDFILTVTRFVPGACPP